MGLRSFREQVQVATDSKKKVAKRARFVSFRDEDGSFRFRLLDADGEQLLLSPAFADGKAAGQASKGLQSGEQLDIRVQGNAFGVWLNDQLVGESPDFADAAAVEAAIARLRDALAQEEA